MALVGTFPRRAVAESQIFSFIEGFYNTRRLHSALGQRSPCEFEREATFPLLLSEKEATVCDVDVIQ